MSSIPDCVAPTAVLVGGEKNWEKKKWRREGELAGGYSKST